jgi:hypothetical protein
MRRPLARLLLTLPLWIGCSDPQPEPGRDARLDRPSNDGLGDRGPTEGSPLDLPRPPPDRAVDLLPPDAPCPDPGVTLAPGVTVSPTGLSAGGSATIVYRAPAKLAGSSNLTLHLGSNFWTPDTAGTLAKDLPMTKRSDGAFEVTTTVPAGARLLDLVFFTESGGKKTWDNNGGLDFHRAVGVQLIGPYLSFRDNLGGQPDRNPATSITVSFRSDHLCRGRVRYGTGPGALVAAADEPAPTLQHHLHLDKLIPDTVYHYRVECTASEACAPAEQSPTASFRTAPQDPTSFSFLHLSDPQDYRSPGDRWKEVAALLSKPPHDAFRFFLITGDLVGGDEPARWWDFFDRGRPLLASKPILPMVGNHDTPTFASNADTSSFEGLFDFGSSSGKDTHYGFRYGSAGFLVLNSESSQVAPADWKPGGAQHGWVVSSLGKLAGATWRFAAWHIPPYNAGVRHSNQVDSVRPITALFDDQLDWVLCGHEHLYQRSKPLRYSGKVVSSHGGSGGGVGYLIAPVAGHDPPEETLLPASNPARALLAYPTPPTVVNDKVSPWAGFVQITVNGKSLQIQAHSIDESAPKDSLSYSKP